MRTKHFGKPLCPFYRKVTSTNKMTLIDKEQIIVGDYKNAKDLLKLKIKIFSNLDIAEYSNCEYLANNISDPFLKCVVKYGTIPAYSL